MLRLTLFVLLIASSLASAQTPRPKQDMILKWNDVALHAIRADRSSPLIASRNLAMMHVAMYDAVMAVERTHVAYLTDVQPLPGTSAEVAAAVAAHHVLVAAYPKQFAQLDAEMTRCWKEDLPRNVNAESSIALGVFLGGRILDARREDGLRLGTIRYTPTPEIGRWRETPPEFREALSPGWGYLKPFAVPRGSMKGPPGPAALTSRAYADAFNEVKRLGHKESRHRTAEQTQIARFWAGDVGTMTPPGHWNKIAQNIARDRGTTLAQNARMFAHLNLSMVDAGIVCWVIKFMTDFWRPVTAIPLADRDGNPDTEKDAAWMPLLNTPPFPAYISGHSTFSAAAAASLAESLGTDKVSFTVGCDDLPEVNRSFKSLSAAAEEAGMSRIYGGIHWQFDNVDGLMMGRAIGEYVSRNTLKARPRP